MNDPKTKTERFDYMADLIEKDVDRIKKNDVFLGTSVALIGMMFLTAYYTILGFMP